MRKFRTIIVLLAASVALSSCGVGAAYVFNHNTNMTQVHLGSKNYKVVDKVSGDSEVTYVLIFGGAKKRSLYQNAYFEMVQNANLENGAKALANVVTEEHAGGVPPFFIKRTITVSANVIEFTE